MADFNSSEYSFDVSFEDITVAPSVLPSTWILDFTDFTRRDKYRAFKLQSYSSWYLWLISSVITLLFLIYWAFVFYVYRGWLQYFVFGFSILVSLLPLWIRTFQLESHEEADTHIRSQLSILESVITIGFTLSTGLTLSMRVINGQCASTSFAFIWGCLPGEICRSIPPDLSLIILLLPLFFAITLPCLPSLVAYAAFLLSVIIIAANLSVVNATTSVSWFICVSVLVAIIMYFYLKQRLELFIFTCNFKRVLDRANSERERNANRFVTQMRNLVFGISHDLKSPLTSTGYGIDLLKLSISEIEEVHNNLGDEFKEKVHWMNCACHNLEASHQLMIMAINRCTDYTKICNSLPLQPQIGIVEIKRIINQCIRVVRSAYEDSNVEVEYSDPVMEEGRIFTDESWFMNNLLCILTNAVSFSGDSSAFISLKWSEISCRKQLLVDVWNNGTVLNEKDREQTFKTPILTSARAAGGVGLGLFCLGRRIDALGGSYGCSEVDRRGLPGMSFWFTMPLIGEALVPDNSTTKLRIQTIDQLKVLVVDDSKTIVKMLKMMLEKEKHFVDTAANGLDAMKVLQSKNFDYHIVLMDLQMPLMDGFATVKLIRSTEASNPTMSKMVVVAMSAGTDEDTLSRIHSSGFDHFLAKPFKLETFNQIWKVYYESKSCVHTEN